MPIVWNAETEAKVSPETLRADGSGPGHKKYRKLTNMLS
jgi:hypothetical protein